MGLCYTPTHDPSSAQQARSPPDVATAPAVVSVLSLHL